MTTFKVGDRVRVYEGCERSGSGIGIVINIDAADGELRVKGDDIDDYFHPKQCRKLVKKNKKTFEIGDRVLINTDSKKLKGTISFKLSDKAFNVKVDNDDRYYYAEINSLKKLVKKRKRLPQYKEQFYEIIETETDKKFKTLEERISKVEEGYCVCDYDLVSAVPYDDGLRCLGCHMLRTKV